MVCTIYIFPIKYLFFLGSHVRIQDAQFMKEKPFDSTSFYSYKLKGPAATIMMMVAADGYIEWLAPEAFPAGYPDNKIMIQRSPFKFPAGQTENRVHLEDTEAKQYSKYPSYLMRIHSEFPQEVIVGDGNFIFQRIHYAQITERCNQIFTPIRKPRNKSLPDAARLFNQNISNIRGVVEREFLFKQKFRRFSREKPYTLDWRTLIHHVRFACTIANMIKTTAPDANLVNEHSHFFTREIVAPICDTNITGVGALYDLRSTLFNLVNHSRINFGLTVNTEEEDIDMGPRPPVTVPRPRCIASCIYLFQHI